MRSGIPSRLMAGLAMALAAVLLAGCASSIDATGAISSDPPEKMYAEADAMMTSGRFEAAAAKFEELDRSHPYSSEARRAIVLSAYAYYKAGKFPEAIASAERYTVMHPGTKDAPFAHYIIASAYFDDMRGANRDQGTTRKALEQFKILKTRYPDSSYAEKVDNRIRICEDTLAAQEMEIGRYYLKRKNYVGAINRFKTVVTEYQTTNHVEEALARLTEAYMALGVKEEAQTAAAVLGYNFPQSKWYKDSYALLQSDGLAPREDGGSWISKAWKSLPSISLGGGTSG
ncbi:MAG: outer membrane protein assembly factor BamD [Hyphomicrobium sp.]|nr:outer membrane protein assembly factor BamD [Hyphomicrobium sp.]